MLVKIVNLRWFRFAMLIFILAFFQVGVLPVVWFFKIKPDLLLVLVVLASLNLEFPKALVFASFCGLFKDVFGLHLFGFNTISFCICSAIVYSVSRYVYKEIPWMKFILIACATILNYLFLTIVFNKPYVLVGLIESALNCLFLPLVAKLLKCSQMSISEKPQVVLN